MLVNSLTGQITGWKYGAGRYITLQYRDSQNFVQTCASSKIDSTGRFSLQNLGSPPQSASGGAVYPSEDQYTKFLDNTFSCTDSSAKFIWGQLEVMGDTFTPYVGWVGRTSYDFNKRSALGGDFDVSYFYVTKDVKLSGTIRARTYAGDTTDIQDITHFDLSFIRGWNQQVRIYSAQTMFKDSNKTVYGNEYILTNYEPYVGMWIYYGN